MGHLEGHQEEDDLPWSSHAEGISEMHHRETYREASPLPPTPMIPSKVQSLGLITGADACPVNWDGDACAADVRELVKVVVCAGSLSGWRSSGCSPNQGAKPDATFSTA